MKRIFIFTLVFFYISLASGVNIKAHFCGGKLKSISFFDKTDKKCCCGKKKKCKNCCKNKTTYLKINDSQNSSKQDITFKDKTFQVYFPLFAITPELDTNVSNAVFYRSPPFKSKNPIYIKTGVLII